MYADLERRRLYWLHKEMKRRCSPQAKEGDYERYFMRGIRVCPPWLGRGGFANFLEDMGYPPDPSFEIDRVDNNGDYTPENCRWTTHEQQHQNRRPHGRAVPPDICTLIVSAVIDGASYQSQADRFGIHPATASLVFNRWLRESHGEQFGIAV